MSAAYIKLTKPFIVLLCFFTLSDSLHAVIILEDQFSGSETHIDFENLSLAEEVINQYAAQGVSFQGGLFQDVFTASKLGNTQEVMNYNPYNGVTTNPVIAEFATPQHRIGFRISGTSSSGQLILLELFDNTDLVEQQLFTTEDILPGGNLPSVFAGIENSDGFNTLSVSNLSNNGFFQMDDFRFETTHTPEPSALLLTSLVLGYAKLRRKV